MSRAIALVDNIISVGFCTCFICNSFLILLTHFFVRRNFGTYKWLITLFAASGIVFATVEHILTPILHNFNSGMVFFTVKNLLDADKWVMEILLSVYCGFLSVTISILAVQFIYRYFAIFSSHKLAYFNGMKLVLWGVYPLLFAAAWALSAYYFTNPAKLSNSSKLYVEEGIHDFYGENLTNLPHLAIVVYDYSIPSQPKIIWDNCYYNFVVFLLLSVQYSIVIFCGFHMNREVKIKTVNFSKSLRKLHGQFFKALLLQIIAPTIILFFPLSFMVAVPFLNCKISFPSGILIGVFSFYPAIDSLILIYVVSDYSRVVKSYFKSIVLVFKSDEKESVRQINKDLSL